MMLVSEATTQSVQTPPQQKIFDYGDQAWEYVLSGSTLLCVIAEVAARILTAPPFYTLAWATLGFTGGFLAKKTLLFYNFSQPLGIRLLAVSRRFSILKGAVLGVSLVASYLFPVLAASCAASVGLVAGFSFWTPRTVDKER